jgi:hypothetical protein
LSLLFYTGFQRLFAELLHMSNTAPEAVFDFRIPLTGPSAPPLAWQEASRYHVWSARHPAGSKPYDIIEQLPEGVVRIPGRERLMHIIPAGRLHRIEHAFGFWRICGADTVHIKSAYDGGYAYLMMIGTASPEYKTDVLRWICNGCGNQLREAEIPTRRVRMRGLVARALDEVRAFNADESIRTCSSCQTVHPKSYGFEPTLDSDIERGARAAW